MFLFFYPMKVILLAAIFSLTVAAAAAQSLSFNSLGDFVKLEHDLPQQTFSIQTTNGAVIITVYSQNVIRVRVTKRANNERSFPIAGNIIRGNLDYGQDNHSFFVSADSLVLHLTKNPVRLTFKTKDGRIINSDAPDFGTSWMGNEVTTWKVLQQGEKFIGWGNASGNLNMRGEALDNIERTAKRLKLADQVPKITTLPFVIGINDGLKYGIFLNNTQWTTFNLGAARNDIAFFRADNGDMDYFFIHHSTVSGIISSFTRLTGRPELPPFSTLASGESSSYSHNDLSRKNQLPKNLHLPFIHSDFFPEIEAMEGMAAVDSMLKCALGNRQLYDHLRPYFYTAIRESTITGMPVIRNHALTFTDDEPVYHPDYRRQILLGSSLLIAPNPDQKEEVKVWLPAGNWYNLYSGNLMEGNRAMIVAALPDRHPAFVAAGSMMPAFAPDYTVMRSLSDTLCVHLFKSFQFEDFEWEYYEDDGLSFEYKSGNYYLRKMIYKSGIREVEFRRPDGDYESRFSHINLIFHGFDEMSNPPRVNGETQHWISYGVKCLFNQGVQNDERLFQPSVVFPNESRNIIINW